MYEKNPIYPLPLSRHLDAAELLIDAILNDVEVVYDGPMGLNSAINLTEEDL